ncbi:MAG: hypothetical protein COT74_00295 [Bdellovibrionales bacterium CG10_big_fil_rev_8_21_14_0_10_45_34]|nr:MAG: hypothetical protein COT74_00295 [Bdellovibrionales bacterium CG10_big_fil_rev_8_21_14_0_10_45_34]
MNIRNIAVMFYSGILVSSVGTFAFNLALVAFMLKANFSLADATLILALQRFIPMLFTAAWGHLTDVIPPRRLIAFAEIFASMASVALYFVWQEANTNYLLLAILCVTRSIVVSFQIGSRNRINKFFSDDTYSGNARQAIWFNKATQGATLFSGLLAWFIISNFDLRFAIIVDAVSFIVNGIIAFMIPNIEFAQATKTISKWSQKFRDLFTINRQAITLDMILVTSMMGTVAYTSRIAGNDQSWIGIYTVSYGLAVWVSGFLERSVTNKISSIPFFSVLGLGCILLGVVPGPGSVSLLICFVRDCAFWTIFHRISGHIQHDTPDNKLGGVSSARSSIMVAIFATGEFLVGLGAPKVSLLSEGILRASVALCAIVYLLTQTRTRKASKDGRSIL